MNKTDIEWVYGSDGTQGYTWNPVVGCSPASEGCDNCYAARIANRFKGTKAFPDGFKVTLHPERLDEPRKLKKPSRIFVCSMSDIFHPDVPDEFIERIFAVMRECPQHTFFVLTKRPERMAGKKWCVCRGMARINSEFVSNWYAPNIWVGVSAENQARANERIPVLLNLPVAHRFVSVEPMIGVVDLTSLPANLHGANGEDVAEDYFNALDGSCYDPQTLDWANPGIFDRLEWVICGAESGPGKRPCRTSWACDLQNDCIEAGVPFFFKKWNDERDGMYCVSSMVMPTCREYPKGM